jgi:hypothetical protein
MKTKVQLGFNFPVGNRKQQENCQKVKLKVEINIALRCALGLSREENKATIRLWYYCAVTGESKKIVFTSGATEKITSGGATSDFWSPHK